MISHQFIQSISKNLNAKLAKQVLEELISQGIQEFCLCPGARNAPFVYPLVNSSNIRIYYWPEERSAAFFALGRIKATGQPVAVVTTSGTAAAELLAAAMEGYYSGLPLVMLTTDRPRRFRGSGAPQSVEQVGLFSCYAHEMHDLEDGNGWHLDNWNRQGPIHLNVCFEEPDDRDCQAIFLEPREELKVHSNLPKFSPDNRYVDFLKSSRYPLVVVGALNPSIKEEAIRFLLHLKAPVYTEGVSGLREDSRLEHLRVTRMEKIWSFSAEHRYPIDGILRIGSVPTIRFWRDLENKSDQLSVCSISDLPFAGLSFADVIMTSLNPFFKWACTINSFDYDFVQWKNADDTAQRDLQNLFVEEPLAEQSLVHFLTCKIPAKSKIYLGNSLPIREWDLAATRQPRGFQMSCSRGVNGIDGQIATFLGLSTEEQDNWAILGDLTVLYDLVAPWITPQLLGISTNVVVINNGGGGIFAQMFTHPAFQNLHQLSFKPFADFWKWRYERWEIVPDKLPLSQGGRLIELIPDTQATKRFVKKLQEI